MKISKSLYVLNSLKTIISTPDLKSLYYTLIYPYLTNGIELGGVPKGYPEESNALQKRAIRCIDKAKYNSSVIPICKKL